MFGFLFLETSLGLFFMFISFVQFQCVNLCFSLYFILLYKKKS